MRRSAAAAAAASIARSHRRLMLQKQRPLLEKLKTLKLTAGPSYGVRPGHVIVELHPDVFKEVQFEEKVSEEMLKKLKDSGLEPGFKNVIIGAVSKFLVSASKGEYGLALHGIMDRYFKLGGDKRIEILAKKVTNEFKLEEKLTKAKISEDLEELRKIMNEIEALLRADLAKQATKQATNGSSLRTTNGSLLRTYGRKLLDILRGAGKLGDK